MLFVEVQPSDASPFSDVLNVQGVDVGGSRASLREPAIPNAIAALLLFIRDQTRQNPHLVLRLEQGRFPLSLS